MSKVDIKRLDSVTKNDTTATEQINDNFQALQAAIENTVSRDGTVPNYMDADLDLNSYRIINAGAPVEGKDVVTLEYFEEKAGGAIEAAAEAKASASKAASSAQSALIASNNAIGQLAQAEGLLTAAEGQLADTRQYVEQARADINQTVEDSIEYVEQEAVKAATEVVGSVVGQYTDRAETAANNAEADASRTAESANQASASATSAATSASEAEAIADEVSVYNFKNKITNCITEIPQDIKLELNNGTLTLKAGSKVYDGNGLFYTLTQDSSSSQGTVTGNALVFFEKNRKTLIYFFPSRCGSGASLPSASSSQLQMFFNTSDGTVYRNVSSTWSKDAGNSLPVALVSMSSGTVTSIDQVFNGFGYIGSTVFALPGVKGLIPDGRNEDGTLKNIEFTIPSVYTRTSDSLSYNYQEFTVATSGIGISNHILNDQENILYYTHGQKITERYVAGKITFSQTAPYAITSFTPKLPFRAVDQNDFNKLDEKVTTLDAQNVKLTGNQMITGVKTAHGVNWGARCTSAVDTGTSLSVMEEKGLLIQDKNGQRIGTFFSGQLTDGRLRTYMCSSRRVNGAITYKTAEIVQEANGKGAFQINCDYAIAPTPTSTDNSTKIATTAWVNTRINPTGNNNSWKITYSNGFKIMGGYLAGTNSGVYTVTFPTAFTNLPAILTGHLGTQGNGYVGTTASSKTGFTASVVSTTGRYTENSNGFTWVAYGF